MFCRYRRRRCRSSIVSLILLQCLCDWILLSRALHPFVYAFYVIYLNSPLIQSKLVCTMEMSQKESSSSATKSCLVVRSSAQFQCKYGSFDRIVDASTDNWCGVRASHVEQIIRGLVRAHVYAQAHTSGIGRLTLASNIRCSAFVQPTQLLGICTVQHSAHTVRAHWVEGIFCLHAILNVWNTFLCICGHHLVYLLWLLSFFFFASIAMPLWFRLFVVQFHIANWFVAKQQHRRISLSSSFAVTSKRQNAHNDYENMLDIY